MGGLGRVRAREGLVEGRVGRSGGSFGREIKLCCKGGKAVSWNICIAVSLAMHRLWGALCLALPTIPFFTKKFPTCTF